MYAYSLFLDVVGFSCFNKQNLRNFIPHFKMLKRHLSIFVFFLVLIATLLIYSMKTMNLPNITYFLKNNMNEFKTDIFQENRVIANKNVSFHAYLRQRDKKLILLYDVKHWQLDYIGENWNAKLFENCSVKDCLISRDKGMYNKSDVVIFALDFSWMHTYKIPPIKVKNQIWIFSEFETPNNIGEKALAVLLKSKKIQHKWNVNWTMGYRRDSDFVIPHGRFKPLESEKYIPKEIFKNKTKTIVWFNSHCRTLSKRENIARKLQKHLHVDIYGECGPNKCTSGNRFKEAFGMINSRRKKDCFHILDTDYKFYLSFENSLCRDYITEKGLHLIMKRNIVPIMRSGANHTLFNPPKSFIDETKFDSIQGLASYLKYLFQNQTAYNEYFTWKKHYYSEGMINSFQETFCEICKRSHESEKYYKIYNDLYEWTFLNILGGACHIPSDF